MQSVNKMMTNNEIYKLALDLTNAKFEESNIYIPAAVNFAIQKNKSALMDIAEVIEKGRMNIIQHYGELNEEGSFVVPEDKIDEANNELKDLLEIEQEIKLYYCDIEALNNVQLTYSQMEAIMFMIEN
jgi:hypothetical protein